METRMINLFPCPFHLCIALVNNTTNAFLHFELIFYYIHYVISYINSFTSSLAKGFRFWWGGGWYKKNHGSEEYSFIEKFWKHIILTIAFFGGLIRGWIAKNKTKTKNKTKKTNNPRAQIWQYFLQQLLLSKP